MKKLRDKNYYPREINIIIGTWKGQKGLLHDFDKGFAIVEIKSEKKLQTLGLHAFELI